MQKILFTVLGCALLFACKSKESQATRPANQFTLPASGQPGSGTHTSLPSVTQTDPSGKVTEIPSNTTNKGNVALNPPHGQPGHRCDIDVGAPLNSPPASQPQVQQQPSVPVPVSSGETALPSSSASKPRLNPPHGQPGHRCDVEVGDPLPQ